MRLCAVAARVLLLPLPLLLLLLLLLLRHPAHPSRPPPLPPSPHTPLQGATNLSATHQHTKDLVVRLALHRALGYLETAEQEVALMRRVLATAARDHGLQVGSGRVWSS